MRSVREYIISVLLLVLLPVLPMSAADEPETGQDGFSAKDVVGSRLVSASDTS